MTSQDKAVEILTSLGLTVLQVKIYITLVKEGKSTIKQIAKTSKVARQDLYRITKQLLNLGLIEKSVSNPTEYEAFHIQEVIGMLIERKRKETIHLVKEATKFLQSYTENREIASKEEEPQFTIINGLQARLLKAKRQIVNSKESIHIVTKWSFFLTYTLEANEEHMIAMNNGAKIKIVTQEPDKIGSIPQEIQKLMKHPNFEIRHISRIPSSMVAIFDRKEVNIPLMIDKSPFETPLLVTNDSVIVELEQNYFKMVWRSALRDIKIEHTKKHM